MQWIKVFTDIFANPKIKILLKERDGDTFFRVWIQLLTIAGQCMQEGKLMISENNPMTVHELATIIHKSDAKMENKYGLDEGEIKTIIESLTNLGYIKKNNTRYKIISTPWD